MSRAATLKVSAQPAAIGYCRVSTVGQADSGLGLEAQASSIATAASRLGLPLRETFTDAGVSGGLPLEQRPGLMAAIGALGAGDVLVVAKRDRLGRDVLNVAMIERLAERKGARIVSAAGEGTDTNDPTSRLMRQIVDCFAEYERALIRARTRAALGVKKAAGGRVGTLPYGYRLDAAGERLEPEPAEQQAIARILVLSAQGFTTRAIAARLNTEGRRTRRGTPWRFQYVHGLLRTAVARRRAA